MSAFLFIKAKIHDPDAYAKYVVEVRELAAKWDSRYIVRRRPVEILEGSPDEWDDVLLLVSEWPSVEIARSIRILSEAIWGAGRWPGRLANTCPAHSADRDRDRRRLAYNESDCKPENSGYTFYRDPPESTLAVPPNAVPISLVEPGTGKEGSCEPSPS